MFQKFFLLLILISFTLEIIEYNNGNESEIFQCKEEITQSPIDIKFYEFKEEKGTIKENTTLKYIKGFFPPLYGEKLDENLEMTINKNQMVKSYILYNNISCVYNTIKLRVHIFAEHTFENNKNDIEIQIMHKKEINSKFICPDNLGISIFFSSQNNKVSNVINKFYRVNEDEKEDFFQRYYLSDVTSLDLNKYTNDNSDYYWYFGSGTFPKKDKLTFTSCDEVLWILFNKVRDISEEELKALIISTMHIYPNGNSRTTGNEDSIRNSQNIEVFYDKNSS